MPSLQSTRSEGRCIHACWCKMAARLRRAEPGFAPSASEDADGRGLDSGGPALQDMGVDHRRSEALVMGMLAARCSALTPWERASGEGTKLDVEVSEWMLRFATALGDRARAEILGDGIRQPVSGKRATSFAPGSGKGS